MLLLALIFGIISVENSTSTGEAKCKSGVCDGLMIAFACIGAILVGVFIFFAVRYHIQTKEEERQITASLVG